MHHQFHEVIHALIRCRAAKLLRDSPAFHEEPELMRRKAVGDVERTIDAIRDLPAGAELMRWLAETGGYVAGRRRRRGTLGAVGKREAARKRVEAGACQMQRVASVA